MNDDLYAEPEPFKPATCGFVPTHGWEHKWDRDGHREWCNRCQEIEHKENYEKYGSEGMDELDEEEESQDQRQG